jgi:hypothetical protein
MSRSKPVGAAPCPRRITPQGSGSRWCATSGTACEPSRRRYRCIDAHTGGFHQFRPPLPGEDTPGGVCPAYGKHVAAHAGPVVSRRYVYRLRAVADALVAVGRGVS